MKTIISLSHGREFRSKVFVIVDRRPPCDFSLGVGGVAASPRARSLLRPLSTVWFLLPRFWGDGGASDERLLQCGSARWRSCVSVSGTPVPLTIYKAFLAHFYPLDRCDENRQTWSLQIKRTPRYPSPFFRSRRLRSGQDADAAPSSTAAMKKGH